LFGTEQLGNQEGLSASDRGYPFQQNAEHPLCATQVGALEVNSLASPTRLPRRAAKRVTRRLEGAVGGPARARVVVLFACVLALESADLSTIGAAAPQLESALQISNTQVGLLAAISTFVGALATLPMGALTDRVVRVRLLAGTIVLWGVAMTASATAPDFSWLLLSRLGLGAVSAGAAPIIASLIGDFFAAAERAKIYGYILSGELLGAGFGFVVSGSIAGALSWRPAFGVLAAPAAILAFIIWRRLPEPARGGQSRLEPGAERIAWGDETAHRGPENAAGAQAPEHRRDGAARHAVLAQNVTPVEAHVLRSDPSRLRLRDAIRYVLSIRTNRWLIAASAIGYFFFAGLRTFALVFVRGQFSLSQPAATLILFLAGLGSLVAVLVSGRLADRLIRRGTLDARLLVAAISYLTAAVVLLPSVLVTTIAIAAPLFVVGAAALAAPNPPLDAARLDLMPARLWGRAEGVRTLLRQTAQAGAPLLFGRLADALGGANAFGSQSTGSAAAAHGLGYAFLIMLVPLALNGAMLFGARRSYPADVATAVASEQAAAG
jgi:MFS family permease